MDTISASVCGSCGQPAENRRPTLLCHPCRSQLAYRPFPAWIKIASVLVLIPLLVAMAQFPGVLSASIAFERGQRAEARGAFAVAVVEYAKVAAQFPETTLPLARKGIAAFHAGQFIVAGNAFNAIAGRPAPADMVSEINDMIEQMEDPTHVAR